MENFYMLKKIITITLILFFTSINVSSLEKNGKENNDKLSNEVILQNIEVAGSEINSIISLGKILLIRYHSAYCAIKFLSFYSNNDEEWEAAYECFCINDAEKNIDNKNKNYYNKKIKLQRLTNDESSVDIWKNDKISCGPITLLWNGFYWYISTPDRFSDNYDFSISLASTEWTEISKVNVFDKNIKWITEVGNPKVDEAGIYTGHIAVPENYLVLFRKANEYGVIKLSGYRKENFTERGSFLRYSGSIDEYASYESFFQGDGSGDFAKKNVMHKTGTVSSVPRGIARAIFNMGDAEIKIGKYKITWKSNSNNHYQILFYSRKSSNKEKDSYELAPTGWKDISEVDVFNPNITWYKYDLKRKRVNVSVDDLCCRK
jgi:hypothetical protein